MVTGDFNQAHTRDDFRSDPYGNRSRTNRMRGNR